ncbi:EAL domain-containing protein [Sulfurimonas sp.]|uniref:EAL domain-containing protein n=1 Tax=Sulfurimonas sp. TaxID=2022749 RepID=UPI00356432DC
MLKNLSITVKVYIPIIFVMLLGILLITYNGMQSLKNISDDAYSTFAQNMQAYVDQGLNEKEQVGLTNVINIANNNNIYDALKQNDRNIAIKNLDNISKSFKNNSDYKNVKVHIHDANINSFLRHWNLNKYGDDLKGFRDSIIDVKESRKPFITIESGRAGMLLRGLSPVMDNDKYIGSVEFIQGFNSIVKKAKEQKKYDLVFLALDNEKGIKRFDSNIYKVGNMFLSQRKNITSRKLLNTLQKVDINNLTTKLFTIKDGYFITSIEMLNHNNVLIGYGLIAADIENVNSFVNATKATLLNQIYTMILIDIIILLSLLLILYILVKKPITNLIYAIHDIENSLKNGDLKDLYSENKLEIKNNDEIGIVSKTINALLKNMTRAFTKIRRINKYSSEYIKAVNAGSIVSKSSPDGIITYVNDTLCKKTGYTKKELIGKPHNIFRHPNTPKKIFRNMWDTIQSGEIYHGLLKNSKKDGSTFYANITIVPIKDENNIIIEYIALRDDVTELVNSKKELKKNFLTDILTSLGNRFKLLEDVKLNGESYLAIIDIHFFKEVNDFYGYKAGDSVIIDLADKMFHYFNDDKFDLYRLNGDEFAVLVDSDRITKDKFFEKLNSFKEEIKQRTFKIDNNEITIQLTIGVSCNSDNLINEADIAHKYAKKSNKDIVGYVDEINIDEEYKKNIEWTNEIKSAIEENRIKAYYQPIVNTSNNKIEKYETLMRLIKRDGEEISPFFFLDIAKKTRLYKDLTKIVVTQAFEKFNGTKYEFSINLSAEDVMLHNVSDWLFDLAIEHGVNNQVVIEIVESEGIESFDMMDSFIRDAKTCGMKIAIDDFGTGYSNFEYLIKLNTDFLKIDGSLIKEIDNDEKIYGVVETIVGFARKNDIKTIGEFVATESIYKKIKELDIDYGQGYFLGKPNPEL